MPLLHMHAQSNLELRNRLSTQLIFHNSHEDMLDIFRAIFLPDIISWEFQSGYLEMDLETYSSEYN